MGATTSPESSILDGLDTRIARAIQLSPRASFHEIADVLGVAEQTIARRYRRLRRDGLLRVTMATDPRALGNSTWVVRVRCRPEGADGIAGALAARDDVSWVSIYEAGWEIVFNLRAAHPHGGMELLTRTLPKAAPVLDVRPAAVLHTFVGGAPTDWEGWHDALTQTEADALAKTRIPSGPDGGRPSSTTIDRTDRAIIDVLTRDGRTSYTDLARAVGSTPGKVTRRVEHLVWSGIAYFDVDLATAALGRDAIAIWLTVHPRHLAATGEALAAHPAVPFAVAVTGAANLTASVMVHDTDELYSFVTDVLGPLDGITSYELLPLLSRVKNAGSLVSGDRLAPPRVSASQISPSQSSPKRRSASSRSAL